MGSIIYLNFVFDAGLGPECDSYLAEQASKDKTFLRECPLKEFWEWVEIADTCSMEKLISFCGKAIIIRWKVDLLDHEMHILSVAYSCANSCRLTKQHTVGSCLPLASHLTYISALCFINCKLHVVGFIVGQYNIKLAMNMKGRVILMGRL